MYWHHICFTQGKFREPRELVKQDTCTASGDRTVKWRVTKCQVSSVDEAWRGMSRRKQFRGWRSHGKLGGAVMSWDWVGTREGVGASGDSIQHQGPFI